MLNAIINHLLVFSGWSAILLVFLLPALESSVFLGFVVPGETAVVVGGFLAYEHKVSFAGILAAAILGAIVGDSIGFAVGERWGDGLLARLPKRLIKPEHVTQGKQMIARLGGRAVFAGRWVSVLRALVPGLCGTSGMRYATFLLWNAIGGITWATLYTLVGYLAGSAWERVEHYTSVVSYVLVGVIAVVIAVVVLVKHRRQHARDAETRAGAGADSAGAAEVDSAGAGAARTEADSASVLAPALAAAGVDAAEAGTARAETVSALPPPPASAPTSADSAERPLTKSGEPSEPLHVAIFTTAASTTSIDPSPMNASASGNPDSNGSTRTSANSAPSSGTSGKTFAPPKHSKTGATTSRWHATTAVAPTSESANSPEGGELPAAAPTSAEESFSEN